MQLTVLDRLVLLSLLPASLEADVTTLRLVRKLREELSFSEDEHRQLQFQVKGNRTSWNNEQESLKEVDIGPRAHAVVRERFEALNQAKQLQDTHVELYDRFVETQES